MNVVLGCLAVAGLVCATVVPRPFARLTESGGSPRLAVAAWLALTVAVAALWLTLATGLILAAITLDEQVSPVAAWCAPFIASVIGDADWTVLVGAPGIVLMWWLIRLLVDVATNVTIIRRFGQQHAAAIRSVGRTVQDSDDVVEVQCPERVIYCVSGCGGTIVLSSGARAALTAEQLDAALAHERAHLAGRHHMTRAVFGALYAAAPQIPLFREADSHVARLLEMRADDVACRRRGRDPLVDALIVLGAPAASTSTLFASGTATFDRVVRLMEPPSRLQQFRARAWLTLATLAAALSTMAPLLTNCPAVGNLLR